MIKLHTAEGRLVRDMWPVSLPRLAHDGRSIEELRDDEKMPEDVEVLQDWGYARYCPGRQDRTRRYIFALARPVSEQAGRVYQAAFRLQGFVVSAKLGPLGNWRALVRFAYESFVACSQRFRTVDHAMRAEQRLVLYGGDHTDIFDAQLNALGKIRSVIFAALASREAPQVRGPKLYLQRKVFTKVRRSEARK